jgi:hypothetical protein
MMHQTQKTMETMYIVTHAIMAICMIVIIGISLTLTSYGAKIPDASELIAKVKTSRLTTDLLYSKIAALLAVFIR